MRRLLPISMLVLAINACGGVSTPEMEKIPEPEKIVYTCEGGMNMVLDSCCGDPEYDDLCFGEYDGQKISDIFLSDFTSSCLNKSEREGPNMPYEERDTTKALRCVEYVCGGINNSPDEPFLKDALETGCRPTSMFHCFQLFYSGVDCN